MLLVVAWDGACWELVEPWIREGHLPNLAGLSERAAVRRLRSTIPPVTFPAWNSFSTAANPGRHGVTDFTIRRPGGYDLQFANSTHRRLPTIWSALSAAGRRVGVYALPATFPAEELNGLQVCGFDTPLGSGGRTGRSHPPELAARIEKRFGSLGIEGPFQSRIETGWYGEAFDLLRTTVQRRTDIVRSLLEAERFDTFLVHFMESDTAAHHFWAGHDPGSPFPCPSDLPRHALRRVYEELDRALGCLLDAAGPDAHVMLVSDHGAGGASDRGIAWNRWLADAGYLSFSGAAGSGRGGSDSIAAGLRRTALQLVPAPWQARLFSMFGGAAGRLESRARFAGIDWSRTRAFSEEQSYQASIWLNVRGRERHGVVAPEDVPAELGRLEALLREFRDPFDGSAVVEEVLRREDICDGPYAGRVPDLTMILREPEGRSYSALPSRGGREPSALRRMVAAEMAGSRGARTAGCHRMHGFYALAGPGIEPGLFEDGRIEDAGATVLAWNGLRPGEQRDGEPFVEIGGIRGAGTSTRTASAGESHLAGGTGLAGETELAGDAALPEETEYSEADAAEVAERLRALGYLE